MVVPPFMFCVPANGLMFCCCIIGCCANIPGCACTDIIGCCVEKGFGCPIVVEKFAEGAEKLADVFMRLFVGWLLVSQRSACEEGVGTTAAGAGEETRSFVNNGSSL